ncbi:hypothetical protein PULV_b0947 [Pseudoalteromonas ulvae UL12]|nr:hypothetical protein [Pseudoalteromonas ulvae UL12]
MRIRIKYANRVQQVIFIDKIIVLICESVQILIAVMVYK